MKREKDKKILMIQKIVIGMTKKQVTRNNKKKAKQMHQKLMGTRGFRGVWRDSNWGGRGRILTKLYFFIEYLQLEHTIRGRGRSTVAPLPDSERTCLA